MHICLQKLYQQNNQLKFLKLSYRKQLQYSTMQSPEIYQVTPPSAQQDIKLKTVRHQNKRKLISIVIALCLSPFYYGYSLTYLSSISKDIKIQTFGGLIAKGYIQGFLYGCITIGAAVGALIAPTLMSFCSRKKFVITINIMAFIVGIVLQIPNIWVLFVGRVFQGIFIGNYMAIIPVYFNQLVPMALKGSLGVFTQLFAIIGKVFCYALGLFLYLVEAGDQFTWRFMFIFTNLTIVIQTVLFFTGCIPDTPNSLLLHGKEQDAYRVLSMFTKEEYLQEVKLQKNFEVAAAKKGIIRLKGFSDKQIDRNKQFQLQEEDQQKIQQKPQEIKIGWKAYLIGFNLPLMQQMTGANAIIVEAGQIVSIYDPSLGVYTPLIINFVQLLATFAATKAIQVMGRRKNILFGNLGLAICDIFLAIFLILSDYWTFAVSIVFGLLLVYMIIYGLSIGPAVWLYVPQILPPKMVPYATVLNWIGCSICIILLPIVSQSFDDNPFVIFFAFAAWSFGAYAINRIFMIETKGLTTRQIYQKYQ